MPFSVVALSIRDGECKAICAVSLAKYRPGVFVEPIQDIVISLLSSSYSVSLVLTLRCCEMAGY